jgi:hypothetical protein
MDSDINDKTVFVKKLNECFEDLIKKNGCHEDFDSLPLIDADDVEKASPNVFVLEGYVPYFNGYDDLPKYIRDLVLDYMNDRSKFSKFGIKNLTFETKDKNVPLKK